ncbi:MAG: DUF1566 domain-containing protein, partial [Proteobacteria bacterium]|nr:DUF1566 domain-containing protein [Pseudomonadota bacterium]
EEDRILPIKFRIEQGIVDDCDPASAVCSDIDGNSCDCAEDCVHCNMTDCPYGWAGKFDPNSGLCWQELQAEHQYKMEWSEAMDVHCEGSLGNNWRMPSISELRTLVRGCTGIEPGGDCEVWDPNCLEVGCYDSVNCFPPECESYDGPGSGSSPTGCYWDAALGGACGWYWSSSRVTMVQGDLAWNVYFNDGSVNGGDLDKELYVRCVTSANVD